MRTLLCPICGSRWKVVTGIELKEGKTSEVVYATCVPCEESAAQLVHEADHIDEDEMGGQDGRDEDQSE